MCLYIWLLLLKFETNHFASCLISFNSFFCTFNQYTLNPTYMGKTNYQNFHKIVYCKSKAWSKKELLEIEKKMGY